MKAQFHVGNQHLTLEEPTIQQIIQNILALNNLERTSVLVYENGNYLLIWGGNNHRVQITYTGRNNVGERVNLKLRDRNLLDNDQFVELIMDGIAEDVPYYMTVSKDEAIELAEYFLITKAVPEELDWQKP